jgi:hypothetical protein
MPIESGKNGLFSEGILSFFSALAPPEHLPRDVGVLWPFDKPEVKRVMDAFYRKFFADNNRRVFLIGINPGRFGAGVTGICFTDPVSLAGDCGISHELKGGRELSSDFVYRVTSAFGGAGEFYRQFYLTALSPVGFVKDGKNLNYYDVKGLPEKLEGWMAEAMAAQIEAGCDRRVAYSMGQGTNFRQLEAFNQRHGFFDRVEPLPHPRWVMQYRRKKLDEFVGLYLSTLKAGAFHES